jgi:hypothetical protein
MKKCISIHLGAYGYCLKSSNQRYNDVLLQNIVSKIKFRLVIQHTHFGAYYDLSNNTFSIHTTSSSLDKITCPSYLRYTKFDYSFRLVDKITKDELVYLSSLPQNRHYTYLKQLKNKHKDLAIKSTLRAITKAISNIPKEEKQQINRIKLSNANQKRELEKYEEKLKKDIIK